jgi:hypothetical protein
VALFAEPQRRFGSSLTPQDSELISFVRQFVLLQHPSLPVCLANAAKSFTEPGSVATIRSTCPACISANPFFARKMGSGQFKPRASTSLSKFIVKLQPSRDDQSQDFNPRHTLAR